MIEQDARAEAIQLGIVAGVAGDWFVDVLTVKLMRWYHKGGIDAMDLAIAKIDVGAVRRTEKL